MTPSRSVGRGICCACVLFAQIASAHNFQRSIGVQVEEKAKNKSLPNNGVRQEVTLQITLRGKAAEPETRRMRWTAYGRDRKSNALSVVQNGESEVDLAMGAGTQKVDAGVISTTSTKSHSIPKTTGRGRNRRVTRTRVDGSGLRYIGYGVQVFDGEKLVGEAFDPPTLETEARSGSPKP